MLETIRRKETAEYAETAEGKKGFYRTVPQFEQFLGTAGIELYIGDNSRISSVRIAVPNANEDDSDAVVRLIEQVADPREYLSRPEKLNAVGEYLNTRLRGDSYELVQIDEAFKLRFPSKSSHNEIRNFAPREMLTKFRNCGLFYNFFGMIMSREISSYFLKSFLN
jgi:hypothetical protein